MRSSEEECSAARVGATPSRTRKEKGEIGARTAPTAYFLLFSVRFHLLNAAKSSASVSDPSLRSSLFCFTFYFLALGGELFSLASVAAVAFGWTGEATTLLILGVAVAFAGEATTFLVLVVAVTFAGEAATILPLAPLVAFLAGCSSS